jgi:hypothetical protein
MGNWTDAVLQFLGQFPRATGGLMYMVLLAAVVFLVFLSVHAQEMGPGADEGHKDHKN